MSQLQILTPFGKIFAPDNGRLREIARNLGITSISRAFGDMLYGTMEFAPVPADSIDACTSACYFAVQGNLIECSESFRLKMPLVDIKAAYRTGTGKLILCGENYNIVNQDGFRPLMRIRRFSQVVACVEILELYTEDCQYNFVVRPSATFMLEWMSKADDYCLFGGGWCVVDLRKFLIDV
ncbi:hypothetical protein SePPVgORF100 [Seal parapoxvirus]|uniref:Uncharacterized protein n=1 Tax=Seal parapoxvirus TaxID=187984 RepID=A0A1Z3GCP8_9POXV|nr:hypothetical protein CGV03_gp100 [Seal parapoxvirus]ASC55538.1 hypothetical protein SePPVgORF100 [Seal parapoxvirus]